VTPVAHCRRAYRVVDTVALVRRWDRVARWWAPLALLAAIRVAIPLAVYADEGHKLPGVPRWVNVGIEGDANGFYAAGREFMAAWARMPHAVAALAFLGAIAGALVLVRTWVARPALRAWLVPAGLFGFGLLVSLGVHWMKPSGAAVFGWPLLWSLGMAPYRVVFGLDRSSGWGIGFVLSLMVVAATVPAVAYLGRNATGKRLAGLLAAVAWTFWPLLVGAIVGHGAWANHQWDVDTGIHLYDEPLSTLLVTTGAALALAPSRRPMCLALSGCAFSLATCVKISDALLAGAVLVVVLLREGVHRTLPYAAGALSFAPVVLVYWPLSYPKLFDNRKSWPSDPFDASYVVSSWTHSSIFTPRTVLILLPLALVGLAAIRGPWAFALIASLLLINPAFYSFYANTAEHPRFLYASLPELFVLWGAAIGLLLDPLSTRRASRGPRTAS